MEAAVSGARANRRSAERHRRLEDHGIVATRVKPDHHARLIDVSAGGALIETTHRLLPGATVELHMESSSRRTDVRGCVLRSAVVRVRPTFVCYQGAIGFDRHLPWLCDVSDREPSSPDARPGAPLRATTTPEVI
jgi:hypothetical protein